MKKGFTMIELLGVITILALLAILAFPPILEQIRKATGSISEATMVLIETATESYMDRNENDYPIYSGNVFCISLQTLVDSGELDSNLTDVKTGATIDLTKVVQVEITSAATIDYSVVDSDACIVSDNTPIANSDRSGANAPELSENMIPI
ncbi:MAG: type II secretion system protein, partial [Bacilli bacterium]|nr:type II secretion system protein [Bacilli bacterium]